jgi:hypothetical protein
LGAAVRARRGVQWSAQSRVSIEGTLEIGPDGEPFAGEPALGIPAGADGVFIAGGNLIVSGSITAKGDLFFAAGGSVRFAKSSKVSARRIIVVSPAGPELNGQLPAEREIHRTPLPNATRVQLAAPVTYRAVSPWFRTSVSFVKFGPAQWLGDVGTGKLRFTFRSARSPASSPSEIDTSTITPWIDRPEDLPISDRIQFRVELELPASPGERPIRFPFVDRVTIPARRS